MNNLNTIGQAKAHLRDNIKKGINCPCCGQYVKMYTRKVTSAMAYGLILLVKSKSEDYFHIENYLKEQNCPSSVRGDISKLRYFKLIKKLEGIRDDGSKRVGYYKVTERGKDFVRGLITVPESVMIFNKKTYGFSENHINIHQALKNKFNYNELMNI